MMKNNITRWECSILISCMFFKWMPRTFIPFVVNHWKNSTWLFLTFLGLRGQKLRFPCLPCSTEMFVEGIDKWGCRGKGASSRRFRFSIESLRRKITGSCMKNARKRSYILWILSVKRTLRIFRNTIKLKTFKGEFV